MTLPQKLQDLIWPGLALFIMSLCLIEYMPNGIFEDDNYFYFQIAKNILDLHQSTFDGIATTNGYHPLWLAILVAAGTPAKLLGIQSPYLYATLFIAASCLVWLLVLARLQGWGMLLGAILAIYAGLGMETPLAALFLILIFDRITNKRPASFWVFLMVATRIDMAIVLLPILLFTKAKDKVPIMIAAILGEACVALYNWLITGHFFSISSMIKSGYAALGPFSIAADNFSSPGNIYRYSVVAILDLILLYFILGNARLRSIGNRPMWMAFLITANAFLFVHTFLSSTRHWYFAPTLLPLLYLWSTLRPSAADATTSFQKTLFGPAPLAVACASGLILFGGYITINWNDMRSSKLFFEQVRRIVPTGEPIYMADGAGFAAWMLNGQQKVIDGDGLVNSFDYFNKILPRCEMQAYFKANQVKYYLLDSIGGDNCPTSCYCLKAGQYRQVIASSSTRKYVSYRLFEMSLDQPTP